jgi:ubiquitin-protein ligase
MDKNKRIIKEYKKIMKYENQYFSICPIKNNLEFWEGIIFGPINSPFEGGIYKFGIFFTEEYPCQPPIIKFISKIRHPNIDFDGRICLNILTNKEWITTLSIIDILMAVYILLSNPNTSDPLDEEMAYYYDNDPEIYYKIVDSLK